MWLTVVAAASAFCGAYVGEAGAELTSGVSEVAIVRQGDRTTLTVRNDFVSNVASFALLLPVPEVLGPEDVRVLDPVVFDHLDVYSGPRLVSYTCEELYPPVPERGCEFSPFMQENTLIFDDPVPNPPEEDVDVEARFIVGEYEIVVLDAEQSGALLAWLDAEGFAVDPSVASLLQGYLDAGAYFFAARVDTTKLGGENRLSPLSFGYESEAFGLPIRLGTGNSPGSQDLVVYAITDRADGRVGISNYPERTVEDECLFRGEPTEFGAFYESTWGQGADAAATWVTEYGWDVFPGGNACDPCPPTETQVPMPGADLAALGFEGIIPDDVPDTAMTSLRGEYYFTRLRMRYTPAQAVEDLVLYASGIKDNTQQRYIQHASYLEDAFPVCGSGWVDRSEAGSCKDEGGDMRRRVNYWRRQDRGGCSTVPGVFGLAAGLALVASRRSRAG